MNNVTELNAVCGAAKAVLSVKNQNAVPWLMSIPESGASAILGRIPENMKSSWVCFAPIEYLAFLDKNGISACVRSYTYNDKSRAWAND